MTAITEPVARRRLGAAAVARGGCVLVATVILLAPFTFGFRPTADQKEFALIGLTKSGWTWMAEAWPWVVSQGRIGHLVDLPMEMAAGRIGDMWFYPYLCIGILVTIAVSQFVWWATLTGERTIAAPWLVYLALLPVGMHAWLPNAYPMMFASVAGALAAKALMLRYSQHWNGDSLHVLLPAVIFVGAVTYELSLALLTLLFAIELVFLFVGRGRGGTWRVPARYAWWNGAVLLVAAATWGLTRYHFGSSYEGNQVPSNPFSHDTLDVTLRHLWTGSIGGWGSPIDVVRNASQQALVAAALLFPAIGFAIYQSPAPARPWWWIGFGVLLALATTLPVTMIERFHQWCFNFNECGYIDSRFALVGLASVAFGAISLLPRSAAVRVAVAVIVALVGVQNFLQNAHAFGPLRDIAAGRERLAKRYVCGDHSLGDIPDAVAAHLAEDPLFNDPNAFHPWHDLAWRKTYWLTYIDHLQHSRFWLCP